MDLYQRNYNGKLSIDGIADITVVQTIQRPTPEKKVLRAGRGGNRSDLKLPGKKSIGELVLDVLVPKGIGDRDMWSAFDATDSEESAIYMGSGVFSECDAVGVPYMQWFLGETWISKIESANEEYLEDNSDLRKRTVTFQITDMQLI